MTRPFGTRRRVVVAIVAAGLAAAWWLELRPSQLAPGEGGLELAGEFFAAALTPAWTYEADFVPDHVAPLPLPGRHPPPGPGPTLCRFGTGISGADEYPDGGTNRSGKNRSGGEYAALVPARIAGRRKRCRRVTSRQFTG